MGCAAPHLRIRVRPPGVRAGRAWLTMTSDTPTTDTEPKKPSDALTRRMATWVNASVAVFTPIFAIAVIFGWISLKTSLEVALCASSCILMCAILMGALSLRRALRRANIPSS